MYSQYLKKSPEFYLLSVSILSKRLVAAEAERSELEQEVRDLQEKMSTLKKSHDKLLIDNKARPELEEHLHTVSDLKKLASWFAYRELLYRLIQLSYFTDCLRMKKISI